MGQKLIQPVNEMILSASFQNEAYRKRFGYSHYGIDCYGSYEVYAQGVGEVMATGTNKTFGNYVMVLYRDVDKAEDTPILARYFHLDKVLTKVGAIVTKDTPIGIMGKTGNATGIHLHLEMTYNYKNLYGNPALKSASSPFYPQKDSTIFNPLKLMHTEKSAGIANQRYLHDGTHYINPADIYLPDIERE